MCKWSQKVLKDFLVYNHYVFLMNDMNEHYTQESGKKILNLDKKKFIMVNISPSLGNPYGELDETAINVGMNIDKCQCWQIKV